MSPLLRQFFQEIGRIGGRRTAKRMTPEERTARARAAAQKRWSKKKKKKKS
jgi:hypothetical protein